MFVSNSIQYPYTGIAPYLTSTYAQYDNGENVFNFYDNFAGTTLSSKWITGVNGGSYTVNNGLTLIVPAIGGDYVYVASASPIANIPIIVEVYANFNGFNMSNYRLGFGLISTQTYLQPPNPSPDQIAWYGDARCTTCVSAMTQANGNNNFVYDVSPIDSNYHLWGFAWLSNEVPFWYNSYSIIATSTSYIPNDTNYLTLSYYVIPSPGGTPTNLQFQWVRLRAYPPNNVMPSNSQPQKTIVLVQ